MSGNRNIDATNSPTVAAIELNNFAVGSLLERFRNYRGASRTMREALQCIMQSLLSFNEQSDILREMNIPVEMPAFPELPPITHEANLIVPPIGVQVISDRSPCPAEAVSRNDLLTVYPIIIETSDAFFIGQRHREEYLATVMSYNLAILNLFAAVPTIEDRRKRAPAEDRSLTGTLFLLRLHTSFKSLHLTLSYIQRWIQSYIDHLTTELLRQNNNRSRQDPFSGVHGTDSESPVINNAFDNELYRKYLVLLIMINSHLMQFVLIGQLPYEYYEYYRSMKMELHSVLTYVELFVLPPSTDPSGNVTASGAA